MKRKYFLILFFVSYLGFSQNIFHLYEGNEDISNWSITGTDIEMFSRDDFTVNGLPGCLSSGVGSINLQNTSTQDRNFKLTSPSFSLTANSLYTLDFGYYYFEFDAMMGDSPLGSISSVLLKDSSGNTIENLIISYNNPSTPYQGNVSFQVNVTGTYYLDFAGEINQVIIEGCNFCYFSDLSLYKNENLSIDKHNNQSNQIILYPNPAKEVVHLITENQVLSKIKIYDMQGKLVLEPETSKTIDISSLNSGIYFITFSIENTPKEITRKLIIK